MAESRLGGLQDFPTKSDLLDIIECPVCREVPFPPIYTCTNGHMVCKECYPKLKKCGLCKSALTKFRNFPLEAIIENSIFHCKYKAKGCSALVKGLSMVDHMKICEFGYNFALCNETRLAICKGEKIRSDLYIEHLQNHHGIKYEVLKNQIQYTFQQASVNVKTGEGIHSDYFEFDEKLFLIKWKKEKDLYFSWISVLGANESEVETYSAEIWIDSVNSNTPVLNLRTMVHTSDKSLEEIKETGCCLCIPEFQVKHLMSSSSEKINNWSVGCKIRLKSAGRQSTEMIAPVDNNPPRLVLVYHSPRRQNRTTPRRGVAGTTEGSQMNPIMPLVPGRQNSSSDDYDFLGNHRE